MLRTNNAKRRIEAGQSLAGVNISFPAPELVELAGSLGFDFVTIDAEHEVFEDSQIREMVRAAELFGVTPIVRLSHDENRELPLLSAGVQGFQFARVKSAADAEAIVESCRSFPIGKRTVYAHGRSIGYPHGPVDRRKWCEEANRELILIAMIEDAEAVDALDDILAVSSIDAFHIGPADLWQSMGMPDGSIVDETIRQVTDRIVRSGKAVSRSISLEGDVASRVASQRENGVSMWTFSMTDLIVASGREVLDMMRDSVGR